MSREICIDVETTGLSLSEDRIVEIGCVEIVGRVPTGKTFHAYVNPDRVVSYGALQVHGLSDDFLADKPSFATIVDEAMAFIGDAPLVAHNASFDTGMLRSELRRLGREMPDNPVVDTLVLARRVKKGGPHTLDALCGHFGIDARRRAERHGALIDAEILAEVYQALCGDRQAGFDLSLDAIKTIHVPVTYGPRRFLSRLTEAEIAAHRALIGTLTNPLWNAYAGSPVA